MITHLTITILTSVALLNMMDFLLEIKYYLYKAITNLAVITQHTTTIPTFAAMKHYIYRIHITIRVAVVAKLTMSKPKCVVENMM